MMKNRIKDSSFGILILICLTNAKSILKNRLLKGSIKGWSSIPLYSLFWVPLLFSSCKNNLPEQKLMENTITELSQNIDQMIIEKENFLKATSNSPMMMDSAKYWIPKSILVRDISNRMIGVINNYKNYLKDKDGDINKPNSYFINNGGDLYDSLENYQQQILSIDKLFTYSIKDKINFYGHTKSDFLETYINGNSNELIHCMMSKLQLDIKKNEYELLKFCCTSLNNLFNPVTYNNTYLSTQNKLHFKAGEQLVFTSQHVHSPANEINNGLMFFVNGKKLETDNNGLRIFRQNIKGNEGKYIVDVKSKWWGDYHINKRVISYSINQ